MQLTHWRQPLSIGLLAIISTMLMACSSQPVQPSDAPLPAWYQKQSANEHHTKASTPATQEPSVAHSKTARVEERNTSQQDDTASDNTKKEQASPSTPVTKTKPATEEQTPSSDTTEETTSEAASDTTDTASTTSSAATNTTTSTTAAAGDTPADTATTETLHQDHYLEPFKATYDISVSKIPMPINATLKLWPLDKPDTWKMQFVVDSFLLHNVEESTFTWNDCHPKSIHYRHDFKGFGHHQFHDTSFFWNPPHVVNHSNEDDKEFAIPANSVDDLTILLQAACFLSEGHKDYYATSIYGDEIRHNHFKLLRHEMLTTPLGKMDTLVIEKVREKKSERRTLFWIAPKLNYMLVKAKHIESPLLFGEVIMDSYKGPHASSAGSN